MRKIIVTEFITLDGVVEAPGGNETDHPHRGWNFWYDDDKAGQYKVDELNSVDALMLGRNTYDKFAAFWPTQTDGDFAARINQLPKYIVSHGLEKAEWNNCSIVRDITTEIPDLKKTNGGDILVYGSGTLVKSLLHHNLVDEFRLMLHPVVIGGGQRLFDDKRELRKFHLKNSIVFDSGLIMLEYVPAVS
ncbi:MAG: dihydrofolate reductase [Chitinophagaceae bacterium]|nr:MAG: dihydrofolate reductase [Chitinophagaceae bacterium]